MYMTWLQVSDLTFDMAVLAKSLIVLGLAFVVSGLVFLLPRRREVSTDRTIGSAEYQFEEMERDRDNREPRIWD